MFSRRDKIIKKDGKKPTDLEEDVAKALSSLESSNKALKTHFALIFINSVENVQYERVDGSAAEYLLVKVPHRSLGSFKKVGSQVIDKLEQQFEKKVIVVANRTIISPNAVHHSSQMRPRSRTLTAVYAEMLNDVVSCSS